MRQWIQKSISFEWEEEYGFWMSIKFCNSDDIAEICKKSKFICNKMKTKNHIEIKNIPNCISSQDLINFLIRDKINEESFDNEYFLALLEYLEINIHN